MFAVEFDATATGMSRSGSPGTSAPLNQVHAGLMTSCSVVSRSLHHAFMVLGVLCGGGVRLLAVLRLVGEQGKLLRDVGCRQAGEAVLHLFGEGTDQRAKSSRCTSFQTVSESEDAVAVEMAQREPIGGYGVFKHNVGLSQGFRLWKRWLGA